MAHGFLSHVTGLKPQVYYQLGYERALAAYDELQRERDAALDEIVRTVEQHEIRRDALVAERDEAVKLLQEAVTGFNSHVGGEAILAVEAFLSRRVVDPEDPA